MFNYTVVGYFIFSSLLFMGFIYTQRKTDDVTAPDLVGFALVSFLPMINVLVVIIAFINFMANPTPKVIFKKFGDKST